jgi:hypothetical protein
MVDGYRQRVASIIPDSVDLLKEISAVFSFSAVSSYS